MEEMPTIETFGEILPGCQIELVADDTLRGRLNLLLWDGSEAHVQRIVRLTPGPESLFQAKEFVPSDIDATIVKAVRIPSYATTFDSDQYLFDAVRDLIQKYTGLTEEYLFPVAASVFASWFVDCIPAPPWLSLIGPRSVQGTQLFQLLSCLYRRSIRLSDLTLAGLCSLPIEAHPALFLDSCQLSPQVQRLIFAPSSADSYFPWRGRVLSVACAKVIYSTEPMSPLATVGRAIEIPVAPFSNSLPILQIAEQQKIADEFQPKLLMYRLKNYHRVANSELDFPQLASTVRQSAQSLVRCLPEKTDGPSKLLPFFADQEEQLEDPATMELHSFIIEAMLSLCHKQNLHSVHVGTVTNRVNELLEKRGEMFELQPRAVGHLLRALNLHSKRIDAEGRGIVLGKTVRERIHRMAANLKMDSGVEDLWNCPQCLAIAAAEKEELQKAYAKLNVEDGNGSQ